MKICVNGIVRDMTPEEEAEMRKSTMDTSPKAINRIQPSEYFSVNGETYKATTTIPAGDTINPGTNCEKVNLIDLLNV